MNKENNLIPIKKPANYVIHKVQRITGEADLKNLAISTKEQPNSDQWLFKLYNLNDETDYIFLDAETLLEILDLIDMTDDDFETIIKDNEIKICTDYRDFYSWLAIKKKNPKIVTITPPPPKPGFFTDLFRIKQKKPYDKLAPGQEFYCIFPKSATERIINQFFIYQKRYHKKFHKEISYED